MAVGEAAALRLERLDHASQEASHPDVAAGAEVILNRGLPLPPPARVVLLLAEKGPASAQQVLVR